MRAAPIAHVVQPDLVCHQRPELLDRDSLGAVILGLRDGILSRIGALAFRVLRDVLGQIAPCPFDRLGLPVIGFHGMHFDPELGQYADRIFLANLNLKRCFICPVRYFDMKARPLSK